MNFAYVMLSFMDYLAIVRPYDSILITFCLRHDMHISSNVVINFGFGSFKDLF